MPGIVRRRASSGSIAPRRSGLSVIEMSAPATMSWKPSSGSRPSERPTVPTMNENSPIWAKPAATVSAIRVG